MKVLNVIEYTGCLNINFSQTTGLHVNWLHGNRLWIMTSLSDSCTEGMW